MGSDLFLTLYNSLPDGPRCCPTGEEQVKVPLNEIDAPDGLAGTAATHTVLIAPPSPAG